MISLIITDDDALIREGLKLIMETQDDIEVCAVCESGEEAVDKCRLLKPDVVLLDIRMPGIGGVEAASLILKENLSKPLLLTTFDEPELILQAMKINVSGYILKSSPTKTILSAIRTVACGGTVFEKEVMGFITSQLGSSPAAMSKTFDDLTERELDVAALIAKGLSNKEIGDKLFISDGTVRNHISSILSKTGLEHRTQIAIHYLGR